MGITKGYHSVFLVTDKPMNLNLALQALVAAIEEGSFRRRAVSRRRNQR